MIRRKSRQELLNEMLSGIIQETGINQVGPGSVTRAIASADSGVVADCYDVLDEAVTNRRIATANGFYLDLIGNDFGLSRKLPSSAVISVEDGILRFSVASGTLVTYLPHPTDTNLGRIPEGTQVTTDSGITFVVDNNYDFPAAAKSASAGAVSADKGTSQQVAAGTLIHHDLNPAITVTNISPVTTGNDVESDDDFRLRISKQVTSSQGRNETAVRLAVLGVPGVADMIRIPYFMGAGSFRLIVIPNGNRMPAESLRQVRDGVARTVSDGTIFRIDEPIYIPISMTVRLLPLAGRAINATDQDLAQQAILRHLGNLRPGNTLIFNRLRSDILGSARNIGDVRIQGVSINRRPVALVDFTLDQDELLVTDDAMDDPVLVS